jgi:hypothetical protein
MKKFDNPIISIAEFDTHILTCLSDIGKNADGVDETTWADLENGFYGRAVELTDIIKTK